MPRERPMYDAAKRILCLLGRAELRPERRHRMIGGRDGLLSSVLHVLEHVERPRWPRRRGLSMRMLMLTCRYSLAWRFGDTIGCGHRLRP
jgi:hypothetical protein